MRFVRWLDFYVPWGGLYLLALRAASAFCITLAIIAAVWVGARMTSIVVRPGQTEAAQDHAAEMRLEKAVAERGPFCE